MSNLAQLEATFHRYISDLERWVPDGIIDIDLPMLHGLNLLERLHTEEYDEQERITQYFHVIEAPEKITLFNDQFAVWIVPDVHQNRPVTYALVGLINEEHIELELVLSATGVYNNSRTVLRVLDCLLREITDTNIELERLTDAS